MFPVEKMCKILKISKSSYYHWLKSGISNRAAKNRVLTKEIEDIFEDSNQTYGSPRITKELRKKGHQVSRPKVARLMKNAGLKSKVKRKYRVTTDSDHKFPVSPNLVKRNFAPDRINKIWVSDITYIRTKQGWLYLTIIMDLFDRQIIGWALSKTIHAVSTIIPAWRMAVAKRKITNELIFHSDRGVQYACNQFRNILKGYPLVKQSMSRKANCWDNAVAESFFKTLKTELIYHNRYNTHYEAELSVFEYIEVWYNRKRLHSSLGYQTPVEYEYNYYQILNAA